MFLRSAIPARQLGSVCGRYAVRCRCTHVASRHPATPSCLSLDECGPFSASKEGDTSLARLEAVLFLAKEPLHTRKLAQLADLDDGTQARTLVSRLNDIYDRAGRAFRVKEVAGGLQLRTRPQFGTWLRRLGHVPAELRLSAPAMETLSVVAYRQPVLRADVEAIRGVACGEILRQLMERDLVRVAGRSEELGRPYLYGTTRQFLQVFGLRSLDELPRAEVFRESLLDSSGEPSQADQNSSTLDSPQQEGESEVSVTFEQQRRDMLTKTSKQERGEKDSDTAPTLAQEDEWDDEDEFDDEDDDDEKIEEDVELDDDEDEWVDDDDDEDEFDDLDDDFEDDDDLDEEDLDDEELDDGDLEEGEQWEEVGDEDLEEEADDVDDDEDWDDEDWDDEDDEDDEDWEE